MPTSKPQTTPRTPSDRTANDSDESDRTKKRGEDRTLGNRPADPNRIDKNVNVPPGVEPDDLWDPGSQTPDAPPVDNRS